MNEDRFYQCPICSGTIRIHGLNDPPVLIDALKESCQEERDEEKASSELPIQPQYIVYYDPGATLDTTGEIVPNHLIAQHLLKNLEEKKSLVIPTNFGISARQPDGSWLVIAPKRGFHE